jgi:pimeloyl-ACP methyl ester carboxylesterase
MGGMTMIAFAGRHPDQLRRQVAAGLFASTGMHELMPRSKVVPMPLAIGRLTVPISAWVIGQPQRGVNKASKLLLRHASLSRTASPAEVDFCARIVESCPPATRRQFATMLSRLDLSGDIAAFDVPSWVVAGTHDRLTPVWHTRRLAAALPQLVEDVELDGVGHMTPVQSPEVINTAIRSLVDKHLAPRVVELDARTARVADLTEVPDGADGIDLTVRAATRGAS